MSEQEAGWNEIDITPPLGLPMGGRGPRFSPGASVLDPLKAEAIYLKDEDGGRALWISLDLVGMSYSSGSKLRYDLASVCEVPIDSIILNFAHIHSGPMTNFDIYAADMEKPQALRNYELTLRKKVLNMALTARKQAEPAEIYLHRGKSDLGINRRNRDRDGEMKMRPNPEGCYNRDLWVLDIQNTNGRCVAFSYGCHPVIVYDYAWQGISSDYPGATRRFLGKAMGNDVEPHFIQGLAGNVRPRVLADMNSGRFRDSRPEDLQEAGRILGKDVLQTLDRPGDKIELELRAIEGLFLAKRDLEATPTLEHWQEMATRDRELERNLGNYWARRFEMGSPLARAVPCSIGLIRLNHGNQIVWISGEPVAEWKDLIHSWLKDDRTTVWGYTQHVSDYLPTDELLEEGGYEVVSSNRYAETGPGPFFPGINDSLRDSITSLSSRIS